MSNAAEQLTSAVFFALGDPTRLAVVQQLGSTGSLTATTLSDNARVTRQAIVKHLKVLEEVQLVTRERLGREVLYSLDTRRLEEARTFLEGISAGWDRAIERLRLLVETENAGGDALK